MAVQNTLPRYMTGGCYALALWLHERSGLPLYGLFDARDDLHHAFVADVAHGIAYDARGSVMFTRITFYRGRKSAGHRVLAADRETVERHRDMMDPVSARALGAYARSQKDLAALLARPGSAPARSRPPAQPK